MYIHSSIIALTVLYVHTQYSITPAIIFFTALAATTTILAKLFLDDPTHPVAHKNGLELTADNGHITCTY